MEKVHSSAIKQGQCPFMEKKSGCPLSEEQLRLLWKPEIKSFKLRNYQTGETSDVDGPFIRGYNDCRQHVCTATFMPVKAHAHQNPAIVDHSEDEFQSLDPEYVLKEAQDYLRIFHQDMKTTEEEYVSRLKEVSAEIEQTGTYRHTAAEVDYGTKLAWRNASRCINRLYWKTFQCLDRRDVQSNEQMFEAICEHIRFAFNGGTLKASVLLMNPQSRVWTSQYFRYACYEQEDQTLLGDPANRELTKVAMQLGWNKKEEERTQWDFLPIIVQVDPNETPSWYELPEDLRLQTFLSHPNPKYDTAMKSLGLRWFCQPYVADKAIEIGGIFYRGVPFSGWFMETEIGRNLCDVQRYNFIPKLAQALDLDVTAAANSQLNIDRIYLEVNAAVLHSFEKAKIAIVDHHTAATGFLKFLKNEVKQRGNTPADWVWIVPPMSGGMSPVFHQEMINYVLKPRVVDQREPWITYALLKKQQEILQSTVERRVRHRWLIVRAARVLIGFALVVMKQRISVNVLYASSSGTAHSYAQQMQKRLRHVGYNPVLMELDSFAFLQQTNNRSINVIVTSTFGQGNAPDGGTKVEQWLKESLEHVDTPVKPPVSFVDHCPQSETIHLRPPLMWCTYTICAIGSSAYPFYCGFGQLMDEAFEKLGGTRLLPLVTCDALNQQFKSYIEWETNSIKALRSAYPHARLRAESLTGSLITSDTSHRHRRSFIEQELSFNTSVRPVHVQVIFYPEKKTIVDLITQTGPFTKDNPFLATVRRNIELVGHHNLPTQCPSLNQSDASTNQSTQFNTVSTEKQHSVRWIVFDTVGLSYHPGDHVCILPENTYANVNDLLVACQWKSDDARLDQHCSLASLTNHKYHTIRMILTQYVDLISTPRPHILSAIATYASDPTEQTQILELSKGIQRYEDWKIHEPTIADMLRQFPSVRIPIDELIQLLPKLQPRYYSISSSTRAYPDELHITVSVVVYTTVRGTIHKGLCSSFLQQTIPSAGNASEEKASTVRLFVIPNAHFRLPRQENLPKGILSEKDLFTPLDHPLLMFAVGSGIAPFRSFWQELQMLRSLRKENGPSVERVLFFGCRTPEDFLFARELQFMRDEEKIFTSIVPVYSRSNATGKQYVQDAVFDHQQLVHSMLSDDQALIYMCGSTRACQGVESALASILEIVTDGEVTIEEAQQQIKLFKQNGKIKQDMFG